MAAIAARYARAFAEVVVDRRMDPDQASAELKAIADLMKSSLELRNVLRNPAVDRKQKLKLLDAIVARNGAPKELRNFLAVLVDQKRIAQIGEIAEEFRHELNRRLGIAEVQVRSIRELSAEEKQSLQKKLEALTGKKVRAAYSQDATLLGGVVIRIGSTIYDGSVRGRLQKIRQKLTAQ